MRSGKLTIATLLVALLALTAAGCGGGGDETTETTAATTEAAPLTKAELIAQGDAICGEANAAIGALGASDAEVPEQIERTSDLYIGMVERLEDLGEPSETDGYEELIAAADELSAVESEAKLASEREDTAALGEAATSAAPILENFAAEARAYGFTECGEGPSAPAATGAGSGVGTEPEVEEGGVEVAPELEEEAPVEEAPEEIAPETGGAGSAGGGVEEAAPEGGGTSGGSSGGVGPG